MGIKLESNDRMVRSIIRTVDRDDLMSEEELRVLREGADIRMQAATGIDPGDDTMKLSVAITLLLDSADVLVAVFEHLRDQARDAGASVAWMDAARRALDYQLACVVAGFKATIEPL